MTYTIRIRTRRLASPPEGLRQEWDEAQVLDGRKIVARFDIREQAERWIAKREAR